MHAIEEYARVSCRRSFTASFRTERFRHLSCRARAARAESYCWIATFLGRAALPPFASNECCRTSATAGSKNGPHLRRKRRGKHDDLPRFRLVRSCRGFSASTEDTATRVRSETNGRRIRGNKHKGLEVAGGASKDTSMTTQAYVHGYSHDEAARLRDQADTLASLLHHDTRYPPGSLVLEAGCGTGAQTVSLARNNPGIRIVAVDRSRESLAIARQRLLAEEIVNVELIEADLMQSDLGSPLFDHVFVCFVLEHVAQPRALLERLCALTKSGGSICAIEGDHGSAFFHPDSMAARRVIDCLVELQCLAGGDANIGRRLYPLFAGVGLDEVAVSPRFVYADASRPELVSGFTLKTFTAMVDGVRDAALSASLIDPEEFQRGIDALRRCSEPDGVFCYTFFKAIGKKV